MGAISRSSSLSSRETSAKDELSDTSTIIPTAKKTFERGSSSLCLDRLDETSDESDLSTSRVTSEIPGPYLSEQRIDEVDSEGYKLRRSKTIHDFKNWHNLYKTSADSEISEPHFDELGPNLKRVDKVKEVFAHTNSGYVSPPTVLWTRVREEKI